MVSPEQGLDEDVAVEEGVEGDAAGSVMKGAPDVSVGEVLGRGDVGSSHSVITALKTSPRGQRTR